MILGGERINATDVKTYLTAYPRVMFANHYGPTECTVSSSFSLIDKNNIDDYLMQPVVGKPVDNTSIYILSDDSELCPIGLPGEICIGGSGVSRGYLNNKTLTDEKFVTDPFSAEPGAKMYTTGDIGRWLDDGTLEYIKRKDDQVKVRGYRVEPGEIEGILHQNKNVRKAVVRADVDANGDNRLVGYIVPEGTFRQEEIVAYLSAKLPAYMVPTLWMELESLPLTPNEKVNRNALPKVDALKQLTSTYQPPRNKTEEAIANIWQDLLRREKIGIFDNFFEIGGHSLLAMRVISSIRKQLDIEMSIQSLFLYPTIEALAKNLPLHEEETLLPPIKVQARPAQIPLSFTQQRLWFIDQLEGSLHYHIPSVLKLKGKLDEEALSYALRCIIDRHEVLRTVIYSDEGQGYQQINNAEGWHLNIVNSFKYKNDHEALSEKVKSLISIPFNLSKDYMLRATLLQLQEDEYVLVAVMHHIASDGWSTSVLVKEVVEFYASFQEGRIAQLQPLSLQYADYAIWQRSYLQGELLNEKLHYWKVKLEGVTPIELPVDLKGLLYKAQGVIVSILRLMKNYLTSYKHLVSSKGLLFL